MRAGSDLADGSCGYMLSCAVNIDFKNTLYYVYTHRPSLLPHTHRAVHHCERTTCSTALHGAHLPSCRPLIPARAGSGLSTHWHAGRRDEGSEHLCRLLSDARLAPWRQQSLPRVVTNIGPGTCGMRRASRPFTVVSSAPASSRNWKSEAGGGGGAVEASGVTLRPSVDWQSQLLRPRDPPRGGIGKPSSRAFFSDASQQLMVLDNSP